MKAIDIFSVIPRNATIMVMDEDGEVLYEGGLERPDVDALAVLDILAVDPVFKVTVSNKVE